ncbi:MAG: histidine phosphatase family protein, partial [Nitrospinaceae bacterium]
AHLGETIVIMAHGGVNRVILGNLLGFPMRNLFRISQEYAAVNRIRFHPGFPRVDLINGAASGTT